MTLNFSPEEHRAYLLAAAYEEVRREFQGSYLLLRKLDDKFFKSPAWKQLLTVGRWLDELGWTISMGTLHWKGYVRYAFQKLSPTIPMPGQLRNDVLLKDYLRSTPDIQHRRKSADELNELYNRIVRPELSGFRRQLRLQS